jgi:hypothetical protein
MLARALAGISAMSRRSSRFHSSENVPRVVACVIAPRRASAVGWGRIVALRHPIESLA